MATVLNRGLRSGIRLVAAGSEASKPASRGFHATGVKRMGGHGHDEPYYLHAKHMYNLHRMKHQALKASLSVIGAVAIGVGVPVYAVIFQQKKTASDSEGYNVNFFRIKPLPQFPLETSQAPCPSFRPGGDRIERAVAMATRALLPQAPLLLLLLLPLFASGEGVAAGEGFARDGRVIELDDSNFEAALASIDFLFVDFYAPWCGHCKRLAPELDEAAPVLAGLSEPIVVAKVNADKYRKLGSKYGVDGFPTLMLFIHGVPIEYTGSRKADQLVRNLKKFVAPDVSILQSDSAIKNFVENAGTSFPIFLGFGVNESLIAEYGEKYKKRAWFAVAKDFSEDIMVAYDFDKVPALVAIHPKYKEQSLFYGPFEGNFLEEFVRQSLLPLVVPINTETLKMLNDDERKVVLAILEDDSDRNSTQLVKVLRSAATANRDLVFGYVGIKQWDEFVETFEVSKSSQLPKLLVWDRNEEYELVDGSERLEEGDQESQISQFIEGYRAGRTTKKKVSGPSFMGFLNSLVSMNSLYILLFVVALLAVMVYFAGQDDTPQPRRVHEE